MAGITPVPAAASLSAYAVRVKGLYLHCPLLGLVINETAKSGQWRYGPLIVTWGVKIEFKKYVFL
jgi:hypothetical protein